MAKLSEHFSKEDFACRCGQCPKDMRMSLTLIGILEDVRTKFQERLDIVTGFLCDSAEPQESGPKKNYHASGKAIDFTLTNKERLIDVFRYLESFPELSGLGLDPQNKYIHIDLREKEPVKWVYAKGEEIVVTDGNRAELGLGDPVVPMAGYTSVSLELPVSIS
jgi:hypothetical protein